MEEIVDGIFTWSRLSEPHGYNFNGYLVRHQGGNVVVDPVEPDEADLEFLRAQGVAAIVITNRNHTRAANEVREATGAITAIHRADADHAQRQGCVIDEAGDVGEMFGPLIMIPAAGKSPGEMALYWPDRHLLIVGDAVIGKPQGQLSLLPEDKIDDIAELRHCLRGLLQIDFDTILVGDGMSILSGAKERLTELVSSFPPEEVAAEPAAGP